MTISIYRVWHSWLPVLKVVLAIAALFAAEYLYDSWQKEQDLFDRCFQVMVFQAAKYDGYWVEADDLHSRRIDGRFVVMASASAPMQWEDLDKGPVDIEAALKSDFVYMIRCTVHQNGIMTSLVVEKHTYANGWEFVDPNRLKKIEKGIEVLERKNNQTEN